MQSYRNHRLCVDKTLTPSACGSQRETVASRCYETGHKRRARPKGRRGGPSLALRACVVALDCASGLGMAGWKPAPLGRWPL